MARHARLLHRRDRAGAGRRGHPDPALGSTWTRPNGNGCATYFRDQIFPVLTPLAVDPAHPFPYISGLSLNLAVRGARPRRRAGAVRPDQGAATTCPRFVAVRPRAPPTAGRALPAGGGADRGPPGPALLRACRSSSTTCSGSPATPTSRSTTTATRTCCRRWSASWPGAGSARRYGWRWPRRSPTHVLDLLVRELDMDGRATWCGCPACWTCPRCGRSTTRCDRPDLKDRPFVPATHPQFAEGETPRSVFARLREGDILVHHPYHSFSTSVQRFIEQAAADPQRAGHQADALPHQRRLAGRGRADRGGPGRQAGGGAGRDQGPLRRAGQHRLGPDAGAGRLPRRLRPGRA